MTLTLEIAPEIERGLTVKAQRAGLPVTDYAMRVLRDVAQAPDETNAVNARLTALDAIPSYNTRAGLPEIEDTSRTAEPDIYGYSEREMEQL